MNIESVYIDGIYQFNRFEIRNISSGVNIIVGKNGIGKTNFLRVIRDAITFIYLDLNESKHNNPQYHTLKSIFFKEGVDIRLTICGKIIEDQLRDYILTDKVINYVNNYSLTNTDRDTEIGYILATLCDETLFPYVLDKITITINNGKIIMTAGDDKILISECVETIIENSMANSESITNEKNAHTIIKTICDDIKLECKCTETIIENSTVNNSESTSNEKPIINWKNIRNIIRWPQLKNINDCQPDFSCKRFINIIARHNSDFNCHKIDPRSINKILPLFNKNCSVHESGANEKILTYEDCLSYENCLSYLIMMVVKLPQIIKNIYDNIASINMDEETTYSNLKYFLEQAENMDLDEEEHKHKYSKKDKEIFQYLKQFPKYKYCETLRLYKEDIEKKSIYQKIQEEYKKIVNKTFDIYFRDPYKHEPMDGIKLDQSAIDKLNNEYRKAQLRSLDPILINVCDDKEKDSELPCECSRGEYELIYFLTSLYGQRSTCILIDEPVTHICPENKLKLIRLLENECLSNQFFMVTHDENFVTERLCKNIIKFTINKDGIRHVNVADIVVSDDTFAKIISEYPKIFFNDNFLLVEGYSDARVFEIIINKLRQTCIVPNYTIVNMEGKSNKIWQVLNMLGSQYKVIYDFDAAIDEPRANPNAVSIKVCNKCKKKINKKKTKCMDCDIIVKIITNDTWEKDIANAEKNKHLICSIINNPYDEINETNILAGLIKYGYIIWPRKYHDLEGVLGTNKKITTKKSYNNICKHIDDNFSFTAAYNEIDLDWNDKEKNIAYFLTSNNTWINNN